jgi:hypothetical protein
MGVVQNGVAHQVVRKNHGGSSNGFDSLEGQQIRVARACADQGAIAWGDVKVCHA